MTRSPDKRGEEFATLKDLFHQAFVFSPADRQPFIDAAAAGDPRLGSELSSLLGACDESEGFFERLSDDLVADGAFVAAAGDDSDDISVNRTISHYEIIDRIGGGGMGVVYKARDTRLGRIVALKFLPMHQVKDARATERLLAEAKTASSLDHPNIGVVYEIGETETGRSFISMAWYDGETLRDVLKRGPLPIGEAARITDQLCNALSAAHAVGIVHRDIKPANVIITRSGTAKLVDFGIARVLSAENRDDHATLGTPAYMSPEQSRGETVDGRTDLWSLGVMLYEMLAGKRPFRGADHRAVATAIQTEAPPSLKSIREDIPNGLSRIVDRCLSKDPSDRFDDAAEMSASLRGALERHASEVSKPPTMDEEAYELYLKGRFCWSQRTKPKLEEALAYFAGALERDPNFALAHSALAEVYVNMSNFEYMPAEAALARAGVAADRAIVLQPTLAEAYSTRGFVLSSTRRFGDAEESFRKSIELNPQYAWAHHYYALLLLMLGRVDDAHEQLESCLAIDPLSLPANATLGIVLALEGRTDDARVQYQHALGLSPEFPLTRYFYGAFEAGEEQIGHAIESLEIALKYAPGFPGVRASLAHCYGRVDRCDEARRLGDELTEAVTTERTRINLALGFAIKGDLDRAFEMLETARWDVPTLIEARANPLLAAFRMDPRYVVLLSAHRLSPSPSRP